MLCKKQSNSTNFKLATGNSGGSSVDIILGFVYLSAKNYIQGPRYYQRLLIIYCY